MVNCSLDSCGRRPASEDGTGSAFTVTAAFKSVAHTFVHAVCDLVTYATIFLACHNLSNE